MNSSQSPSPQLGKSTYSSATRRDVLWNVVEPGDPYDIRKSMIAKLPGDRQHFMGDNLEIVCLFQSAEIQRLCQFLDDYKFRYREIERRQLDRHSYEVQIKQLTQQLADSGSFRSENVKLKDFIKKQTVHWYQPQLEIEELKNNKHYVDNNLRANYESSLAQIQTLIKQNAYLKSEKENLILQINSYSIKIQALESARDQELKQLFHKYSEQNKYALENETKLLKSRYESEFSRYQFEIKRLKEFNETKNQEINQLTTRNHNLLLELEELTRPKPDSTYITQFEERFAIMGQEIERLNLRIRQSTAKIDESSRNELYWKDKYSRAEEDYKSLQMRYRQSSEQYKLITAQFQKLQSSHSTSNQSERYEEQIRQLKDEIRKLENERGSETARLASLQRQYNELEYNYSRISVVERENAQLKTSVANVQELRKKIAEYEAKVALLSQEIERLNLMSQKSNVQYQGYDELKQDFDEFKRKSLEKQKNITQIYESEMQKRVLEYETRLAKYAEESGNQFEIRLQAINREVEKLNQYLKEKTEQSELNKKRIRELENSINQKYQVDTTRQFSTYELTIKDLKTQNEQLTRRVRELDTSNRRIAEYENRLVLLTQQVERLSFQLKLKTDQIENLRRLSLTDQKPTTSFQDFEISRKISIYEQTQSKLSRENEDLRRKLQQIVELNRRLREYEDRIRIMSQENERLNLNFKEKLELLNRSELNIRNLTQELEMLRRNKSEIQSSFSQRIEYEKLETSRKFTTYEQSLSSIQRQYDQLRKRMTNLGNDNNRKITEYENRIVLLTQEIERLNQNMKIKINQYQTALQAQRNELEFSRRENKELQINITQKYELETSRKIGVYEQNMSGLAREVEDLRRRIYEYQNNIRKKNEEVNQLENRYRVVSQEYENFKFQFKSFEGEVNRSQSSYQQNMTRITRQYEDMKRKLIEYEGRITMSNQQNERLNVLIRNGNQQIETLRRTINQIKVQFTQKYEIEASRKISGYEQNLNLVNREKEQFKRKIVEYETRFSNLTRELEEKNRRLIEWQNKWKQSIQENEVLSNRYKELQVTVSQKYEIEASRKFTNYEQNIQNLGREIENYRLKINEYENLRVNYEKQINRLNGVLKNSVEEQEKLRIRIRETETTVTQKYEGEVTRQFTIFEQNISNLNVQIEEFRRKLMNSEQANKNQGIEIEELRRRLKEYGDVHRVATQYENQFKLLKQQLERLNSNLKMKVEESINLENRLRASFQQNEELKRVIKQVQISLTNKYQLEFNQKSTSFEQSLGNYKRETEDLRRKVGQLQSKIVFMTQQIQRLNNVLKGKVEELNQSEMRGRNWQLEIQNIRRRIGDVEKSSSQRLETQMTRTVALYEQNITTITREYDEFKRNSQRIIAELETKIALLSQELERSNQALRLKTQEAGQNELRLKNAVQEIEKLQRVIKQLQIASSKRLDSQKTTIISTYEQNMTVITRQFEQFKLESGRKVADYESKIMQLMRELERINGNLAKKVEETTVSERKILQLNQEIESLRRQLKENQLSFNQRYQVEINRKVSTYEQNFTNLKSEQESYKRRIAEDENRIALMTQEIERLNQVLKTKSDESKHYQTEIQKYAIELQKLKSNISGYYTMEIEKLNGIIKQRTQEYQQLQQKFSQLQSGQSSEFKELQSSYSLVSKEYENSKKHLTQYEQSIRKLYSEFERLQVIINELKVQRQTLFDKNHGLLKEIERLTAENKDQQSQIYELRLKFSDEVALQKRINEHMALMVVLFAEIETLRQRVKDKEKQVQEVRRSSLAPLKA